MDTSGRRLFLGLESRTWEIMNAAAAGEAKQIADEELSR